MRTHRIAAPLAAAAPRAAPAAAGAQDVVPLASANVVLNCPALAFVDQARRG